MKTERLYYTDSYLREFRASVADRGDGGHRIYLDRTAFYPTSGGQPHDTGTIAGVRVVDVVDEDDRIAHVLERPVDGGEVECRIDWARRFDHMQQHTGQHLLSAVLLDLYRAQTIGFHLGAESSNIDIGAGALDSQQAAEATDRANSQVFENRPVGVSFEDASGDLGLRKATERRGTVRIISIDGYDRSACGGTHVRATGEIGPILIRKLEKAHGSVRVEFLCGLRAVRRARADYEALARIGRAFSAPLDETPELVTAQMQALDAAEKARRKLAAELARVRGRELYSETAPDANGFRAVVRRVAKGTVDDEMRAFAQGFALNPRAFFLGVAEEAGALLVAVSADSGLNAGEMVKRAVTAEGGRGGGNASVAQGSVPSREALERVLEKLAKNTSGKD